MNVPNESACGASAQLIERFDCRYLPMDKKVIENLQSFNR